MRDRTPGDNRRTTGIRWPRIALVLILLVTAWIAGWTWWAEGHPSEERELRVFVHRQLTQLFPEAMSIESDAWYGLVERHPAAPDAKIRVLLVHGLDEPGSIWDDLLPALAETGLGVWELRYPNDQGIDRSSDYLAGLWPELPPDLPIALVGHSMGGLVIRDWLTNRYSRMPGSDGQQEAAILGAILVGTPNHGSEWARLRIWLELRDHVVGSPERRFSLLSALRDGVGEAKVDLRPDSDFLASLNARPWPAAVPIQLIGGRLIRPTAEMTRNLAGIGEDLGSEELTRRLTRWWTGLGSDLGDGVVTLESLRIPGVAEPILVEGSHRGMLLRYHRADPAPAAIAPILETLKRWTDDRGAR
ncbi:lecithin--cholesterol acyltransferase [Imhoffiella purpurea]|uniref:AB hydrolase-1 domain-containing protein n=1 Tax=Imhoffiella purpurea TaxID=1249627 RepID=W9VGF1_9GAMM|nr:lecithin--cholesterol acyltransferase [Imhoffiella purpurea]EXJ16081.1 hypothetical protein D779_0550 [Imhoffiella purpurea]